MTVVLDTSALLALLWNEEGAERVEQALHRAELSAVCQAELIARLHDRGGSSEQIDQVTEALGLPIVAFDGEQASEAADLRQLEAARGLPLCDRASLALAITRQARVLTANSALAALTEDLPIEVEMIR